MKLRSQNSQFVQLGPSTSCLYIWIYFNCPICEWIVGNIMGENNAGIYYLLHAENKARTFLQQDVI